MKIFTIILLLLLFISFDIYSNTYFVATDGNDANIGTEALAWKTIQKAASTIIAGDTVMVKSGIYNERVIVQNSGTSNNYIVFSNYQNDTVTIDGTSINWGNSWNGLLDITDKNYIQIKGFRIINADYGGIWVDNSHHIIIKENYTYNTFSSGIGVWNSSYVTIDNNEIELACNDGEQECISIANSNNCDIYKNNVHDNGLGTNGGEGIDVKQGSHNINVYQNEVHHLNSRLGIYADAWDAHTYNINIYGNTIHHCSETGLAVASESGGLIEYINIYNNIIYLNQYGGIELGSWSDIGFAGVKPIEHINIVNNTCYKNGAFNNGWGFGIVIDNPNAKDVIIRNNICSENSAQIAIQQIYSGGVVDHNLLFGNNVAIGTLYGSDSITVNPLFADTALCDLHLTINSPAIDNGSLVNSPDIDFDSISRPLGSGIDIGAYEYSPTSDIKNNNNLGNYINIYPNPAFEKLSISIDGESYENYTIELININGSIVKRELLNEVKEGVITININNLKPGLYLLKLLNGKNEVLNTKVIIK